MCGIAGELHFNGAYADAAAIQRMCAVMAPRGPDGEGLVLRGGVGLGHRRLQIIDLSENGQQPMVDAELGLSLAFNGCIYNYQDLRSELQQAGYRFFSHSYTEVILKAWHAWGVAALKRFNGMFAFVIHERASGRVIFARDRLGIKPFYYTASSGRVRFSSSLPALLAAGDVDTTIDPVALHYYFHFHAVVPPPHTILNGVKKVPPATVRIYEPDGSFADTQWWSVTPQPDAELHSDAEWVDVTLATMRQAVQRRLVADVPVGVLLSGGLDSSLIVGLLAEAGQQLETFSIGFETVGTEVGDEFVYSDIIAQKFGTKHHKIVVDSQTFLPNLLDCIKSQTEPMVSHDNIGFYLLSQEVAKHVKVVQSGQGADEIFAGYRWYPPLMHTPEAEAPAAYAEVFCDRSQAEYERIIGSAYRGGADHSRAFIRNWFGQLAGVPSVDKALHIDCNVMLVDDPVKRVDNMTMAAGLEARVPFLDHEVVEMVARMPAHLKTAQDGKGVLKDVGRRIIPSEVIDRPKGYFPVPALKYLRGPYLDLVRDAVTGDRFQARGLIEADYVAELLADPEAHITPLQGSKLWQVALLELWFQAHDL